MRATIRRGDSRMEPDPLVNPPLGGKKSNKSSIQQHVKRPSFSTLHIDSVGPVRGTSLMNLVFCVMCAMCFSSSVYFGYREMAMEGRLEALELQVGLLKKSAAEPSDVLVERLRRQVESHVHRRVTREVALQAAFLTRANEPHTRNVRDAPECVCPPGMSH